jgi:hypothetical protein
LAARFRRDESGSVENAAIGGLWMCCAAPPARVKRHPSPRRACLAGDFPCLTARSEMGRSGLSNRDF